MRKNGLYLRLSIADGDLGKDNKDESNSIDNQRTLLVNFVQDRDDMSDEYIEYVDDGYSGTNFERPAFKSMIEDAKTGKIDTIIVKDFSRFGRDYIGVGDYLEQVLPILGIRFISLNNNYDSNDYLGKTMGMDMAIHNLVNNLYSKDISKKLKSALRVKWRNGQWTGGKPPFGYLRNKETGEWLIDPVAGKYVRMVFDKAIEGCNTSQISYYMNEQKIPTPGRYNKENGLTHYGYNQKLPESEVLWNCGMVRAILGRYEYTGALVQGKRQSIAVGSKVTRKSKDKDVVITKDTHPAIVSEEEYEIAKASIAFMKKPDYRGTRKFALKGKVRCGNCKRAMVLVESGSNDKMYCPHKKTTGKFAKCSGEMFSVSIIEGHVWYALKRVFYILDGKDGNRTAFDRLEQHATLQKILTEYRNDHPDKHIYILLLEIQKQLAMSFDGRSKEYMKTEEESDKHMKQVCCNLPEEDQVINITEAALINYFKPEYNINFVDNFPNENHKGYRQYYDLDYNSLLVELDLEFDHAPLIQLYTSTNRINSSFDFIRYQLFNDNERSNMYEIFAKE